MVAEKDRRERTMTTGDTASITVYTLGNPLTKWYSVTCVNRGYTQSAWGKTGKHCRHLDLQVMSAITGVCVALTRENVRPRVAGREIYEF